MMNGPLKPGAEAVGEQVVGLTGVGVLGEVALVGEPEAEVEDRRREDEQEQGAGDDPEPRAALDGAAPPVGEGLADRLRRPVRHLLAERADGEADEHGERGEAGSDGGQGRDADADAEQGDGDEAGGDQAAPAGDLDPFPGEAQQGGQEEDRGDHRGEHGDGDADAQSGDPADPDQEQAEQRHDDGDAGEDHGPAGGVHRRDRRLAWRAAGVDPFPVAGDDEQGVVDADAEPDHGPQEGGEVGDVDDVAEDDDQAEPGADAAEGDGDRQAHREHRAEGEDQHDDGEGEADELGLRRFEHGEGLAAGEDLEAVDGGRCVGDRLAECGRLGQADIGGQVDLGVGELAGQRTLAGDLRRALLGVGGDDGGAGVLGVAVLRRGTRRSTVAKSSSMAAVTAGSSMPWSARNTIVPDAPPAPSSGKYRSSTSKPSALSEAGTSGDPS